MSRKKSPDSEIRRNLSNRWYNLMGRCNNSNHPRYQQYGGSGVSVCDKWLNKESFIQDVTKLPGYSKTELFSGKLHLDKDTKIPGNKVYSPDTCMFIQQKDNNKVKPNQMVNFIAISPNGESFESSNQSDFAREHNLRQSSIADCLSGRLKTTQGWVFKKKE